MLCHDSPAERIASHQTFPDRSRVLNGLSPTMWQIELIDQVTWWTRAMRTSPAQKNAETMPHHDQVSRPPRIAGTTSEASTSEGKDLEIRTMSRSLRRSGAYLC